MQDLRLQRMNIVKPFIASADDKTRKVYFDSGSNVRPFTAVEISRIYAIKVIEPGATKSVAVIALDSEKDLSFGLSVQMKGPSRSPAPKTHGLSLYSSNVLNYI